MYIRYKALFIQTSMAGGPVLDKQVQGAVVRLNDQWVVLRLRTS